MIAKRDTMEKISGFMKGERNPPNHKIRNKKLQIKISLLAKESFFIPKDFYFD